MYLPITNHVNQTKTSNKGKEFLTNETRKQNSFSLVLHAQFYFNCASMLYRDTNQAKKSHREKREKLQNRTVLLWRGLAKKLTKRTSTLKPNGIHGITISREETSRMVIDPPSQVSSLDQGIQKEVGWTRRNLLVC